MIKTKELKRELYETKCKIHSAKRALFREEHGSRLVYGKLVLIGIEKKLDNLRYFIGDVHSIGETWFSLKHPDFELLDPVEFRGNKTPMILPSNFRFYDYTEVFYLKYGKTEIENFLREELRWNETAEWVSHLKE